MLQLSLNLRPRYLPVVICSCALRRVACCIASFSVFGMLEVTRACHRLWPLRLIPSGEDQGCASPLTHSCAVL